MRSKSYTCIFFDLDHTLWDYETNSRETLRDLYGKFELSSLGARSFESFYEGFVKINNDIWERFDRGEIHRDVIRYERFHLVLQQSGINNYTMSLDFSNHYLRESPKKKNLVPFAKEALDYLRDKYELFVITNGFDEIQCTKLQSAGITDYFKGVVTSARAGSKKPQKEIFEFALRENGHASSASIMVGDNLLTDIAGARNASIDCVFYNPNRLTHGETVTYEINELRELANIL